MIGGAYLCYEGAEKVFEALFPHEAHEHEAETRADRPPMPAALENAAVAGAIQTDFILSAEIMAIALAALPEMPFWKQALVLAVVGIGITLARLWRRRADRQSRRCRPRAGPQGAAPAPARALGRGILVRHAVGHAVRSASSARRP